MVRTNGGPRKKVADLIHGDETIEFGKVTHREGRKVWFERRIVTFPSDREEIEVTPESFQAEYDE